jgi:hypothetical protein
MSVFTPDTETSALADWMRIMHVAALGTLLALAVIAAMIFSPLW